MAYLDGVDPEGFDPVTYLDSVIPPGISRGTALKTPDGRRAITRHDPLAFALIYLSRHLRSEDTGDRITMSVFHLDLYQEARGWERRWGPQERRSAWVAPRNAAKSTLGFLILPLWALAHGHRKFVLAFADTGPQANKHMISITREFDGNALLRADYPDLCSPATRPSGVTVSDRQGTYIARSGAVFMGRGADAATLGAKIENRRPDLILLDDLEPQESVYSLYQRDKRLDTVRSSIFPMSLTAVVIFLGTTVMAGSIIHDLVRQVTEPGDAPAWPRVESIRVHYFPPIITRDDGTQASLWPARWPLDFLRGLVGTASYAKNFLNQPSSIEGGLWQEGDITVAELPGASRRILVIDPSVTARKTSDLTGVAVVSCRPARGPVRDRAGRVTEPGMPARCLVEHAEGVRLTGRRLADHLAHLVATYPVAIHAVLVETNQGGDLWGEVLQAIPLKVITRWASDGKDHRFARALEWYQHRPEPLVVHARRLPALEVEMLGYPRAATDDIADAVVAGLEYFLAPPPRKRAGVQVDSYL